MTDQERFFYAHAGYSYRPDETPMQGRERCAKRLALAENWAHEQRVSFEWQPDGLSDWDDEDKHEVWACVARDANGAVIGSLGGVDFGADRDPWGDPYRVVVEAEIALEAMPD